MQEPFCSLCSVAFVIEYCRIYSLCGRFLNDRINITIHNKIIAKLFICHHWTLHRLGPDKEAELCKKMGLWGIISWLTLFPATIYLWIKNGHFNFFLVDELPFWYVFLFSCLLILVAADVTVAILFDQWRKRKRKAPKILKNVDLSTIPPELKEQVERIYRQPDKVICDDDQQEYYYICGKELLRLRFDGTFVSLTPEADSRRVLTAIRTGRATTFR